MTSVPDFPLSATDVDMVNKDQREAWLEGAIRIALDDLKYIRDNGDEHTKRSRLGAAIRHLELTVEKINQADNARKQYWINKNKEAVERAQRAQVILDRSPSQRLLPQVDPTPGDDRPLFVQSQANIFGGPYKS